ncbi:hypothetical protein, partial [Streptomyces sp. NPDC058953]|uniref:hypothetical protein n=1 Tax=Streptomyces sp. NPDC058953 TaxID=3346676 RepID=UPI003690DD28
VMRAGHTAPGPYDLGGVWPGLWFVGAGGPADATVADHPVGVVDPIDPADPADPVGVIGVFGRSVTDLAAP